MSHLSPTTLTTDEQRLILRATAGNARDHTFISLGLGTGLRSAEIVGLDVGDVFAPDGTPRVRVGIDRRSGSLGQFGSIPFIERVIETVKSECTRLIIVPYSAAAARKELASFQRWYNAVRPHERLQGATPDEVYEGAAPYWERARFEPRPQWRRTARCASPQSRIAGGCGARLELHVNYLDGREHLPVISLRRVA